MNNAGSSTVMGDGRCVRVAANSGLLLVVGNRVDVEVQRNDGQVRVVGNHGRVVVTCNRGSVHYVGNGGCVRTGGGRVDYVGNNGHVDRDLRAEAAPCSCPAPAASAPAAGTTCGEPVVLVAHRPHARAAFREMHLRPNSPATTINIDVSSAAECDKWRAKFSKGFWIAT